ncbi:MAG TPA: AAA family ATPase, partial [Solirubrobacteraceae bacterium]|nr:AAA family ATPase [Solirubrobacteraceae bacterium]
MSGGSGGSGGQVIDGALVEREGELSTLRAALSAAGEGAGSVTVIEGAAGLGKSRLLEEIGQVAGARGLAVLRARGDELEAALPWALTRGLLAPALAQLTPVSRRRMLQAAGEEATELLARRSSRSEAISEQALLARRAHSLTWLVADLAARAPTALLIDDLHWADEPSLHFLAYLAARADALPVAMVIALRPPAAEPTTGMLRRVVGHPRARVIELAPLSAGGIATLVTAAFGAGVEDSVIRACEETTAGNPFYLHELLRDLSADRAQGHVPDAAAVRTATPTSVMRSVRVRLDRLGAPALALARAVAVLGSGVSLTHAAELAELQPPAAADALEDLAAAQILRAEEPLGFVHPLVAGAVHEDLGVSMRGQLHLRAARMLAGERIDLQRVAIHLLAAASRGEQWVVDTLRAAAAAARAEGAATLAADYLTRALQEPPDGSRRAQLLCELGSVEVSIGRPLAAEHLRAALELTAAAEERAELTLELGRALMLAGEHRRAGELFSEDPAVLDDPDSELARELRAAWWMCATLDTGSRQDAIAATPPDVAAWTGPLTRGQRQLLAQLAQQRAFEGAPTREVRALAERAWGEGELLRVEGCDGIAWSLVPGALVVVDELELELDICDSVMAEAQLRGSPMAYATVSYCRAWPLLHRGQVDEAVACAGFAVAARSDGWAQFVGAAAAILAIATLEQGEPGAAQAVLAPLLTDPQMQRSSEYALLLWANARLAIRQGRAAEGLQALQELGQMLVALGIDRPSIVPWRCDAAGAAVLLGDTSQALALAGEDLEIARRSGIPRLVARALRTRARAQRGEQAIASLQQALSALDGSPPRLERTHVLVELGAALRRAHRRAQARTHLQQGLHLARAGGVRALAELAESELAAAGVRAEPATVGAGTDGLTPS